MNWGNISHVSVVHHLSVDVSRHVVNGIVHLVVVLCGLPLPIPLQVFPQSLDDLLTAAPLSNFLRGNLLGPPLRPTDPTVDSTAAMLLD